MKDFFKSFQRSFRRKKKQEPPQATAQKQKARKQSLAPTQVGGAGLATAAPPVETRRRTWANKGGSPPPLRSNSMRGEERHPGRRFTVTEDMDSAWMMGGAGGHGAEEHGDR